MDCDLGRKLPFLRDEFKKSLINGKVIGTKRNYATCVMDYFRFCNGLEIDPFRGRGLNPTAVQYWMQTRIWMLGSSNSHTTWSASLTWLCKCAGFQHKPRPMWQMDPNYAFFYENAIVANHRKVAVKAPLHIRQLVHYIKNRLKIDPTNLRAAKYDDLLKAFLLVLNFMTLSRPMELLWSDKTEDKAVREIYTGVRWQHIKEGRRKGYHSERVLILYIPWFKNQDDRTVSKKIVMCEPTCGKSHHECVCPYFAMWPYLTELHRRRTKRERHPEYITGKRRSKLNGRQTKHLGTREEDYVFVNANGTICGYDFIRRLIKDIRSFCNLESNSPKITPYSLRIGGTSLAHHQGIDPLRIMRYVEWKPAKCPTMHSRYVQYTEKQLSTVPFEILHGTLQFGGVPVNYINTEPETFILRDEVIKAALYSGDNAAMAKMRHQQPQYN